MSSPRIFASGVYGSDFDVWGAWSFSDAGTRNRLGEEIGPNDYCLSIGMMGNDTPEHERGRLLALIRIGPEQILTPELVHPDKWRQSVQRYGQRWMYAFPIRSVERFDERPLRSLILPRIGRENLYRTVGRHFVELTSGEVSKVLALPRTADPNIYTTTVSAFASRLLKTRRGPIPKPGERTLTAKSGPAATYCLELVGSAVSQATEPLGLNPSLKILKVGFSTNPERRIGEINAYLPCEDALCWKLVRCQWHEDEINAWAMEQRIFDFLEDRGIPPLKGEIVCAGADEFTAFWEAALRTSERPSHSVSVPVVD